MFGIIRIVFFFCCCDDYSEMGTKMIDYESNGCITIEDGFKKMFYFFFLFCFELLFLFISFF